MGFCLACSNPKIPKREGISLFLLDMHAPGVTVRLLRELTGSALFNEVFLEYVFVPDQNLIGAVDHGWEVARNTMSNERVSTYEEWRQRWPALVVRQQTQDAAALLQRYFAMDSSDLPSYSGARFEAIAALSDESYSIGLDDFTAISMLGVNVPAQAAIRLLGPDAEEITALLKQIPMDCNIIEVDPDELTTGSAASKLWDVLRDPRDGLGPTKTSKLIAAKRPRLIPIWDSFVKKATGLDTLDYWRRFQQVLTVDYYAVWN